MKRFLVQNININGQQIQGPLSGINSIADLINKILPFLYSIAAVILIFVFIWGGYDYMLSQGNPEKVKSASSKITAGLIGFGLLIFAYFITRLIVFIFLGSGNGLF
jgi:TRAP-type C4-dicarboxylate transport system permease small subunit